MRTSKLLGDMRRFLSGAVFVLWVVLPSSALGGMHYGVRTDVLQPIYAFKNGLWYGNLHTQIPSMDKDTNLWLVNFCSGARGLLTPYFIFGAHISAGQLNHSFGKSYWVNPGMECWFPLLKVEIHAYFTQHDTLEKADQSATEAINVAQWAADVKLSLTSLSFVRPFLASYYLLKSNMHDASNDGSPLRFAWGGEWLISPQISLEFQNDIGQRNLLIRSKWHSVKVYKPSSTHVAHYLREPVDQYVLPISLLHTASEKKSIPTPEPASEQERMDLEREVVQAAHNLSRESSIGSAVYHQYCSPPCAQELPADSSVPQNLSSRNHPRDSGQTAVPANRVRVLPTQAGAGLLESTTAVRSITSMAPPPKQTVENGRVSAQRSALPRPVREANLGPPAARLAQPRLASGLAQNRPTPKELEAGARRVQNKISSTAVKPPKRDRDSVTQP